MGANVHAYLVGDPREVRGDAATDLNRWKKAGGKLFVDRTGKPATSAEFADDAIIIDALLGTGVRGPVEGRLAEVIANVNSHKPGCDVVAVDIPSGLQADKDKSAAPSLSRTVRSRSRRPSPAFC